MADETAYNSQPELRVVPSSTPERNTPRNEKDAALLAQVAGPDLADSAKAFQALASTDPERNLQTLATGENIDLAIKTRHLPEGVQNVIQGIKPAFDAEKKRLGITAESDEQVAARDFIQRADSAAHADPVLPLSPIDRRFTEARMAEEPRISPLSPTTSTTHEQLPGNENHTPNDILHAFTGNEVTAGLHTVDAPHSDPSPVDIARTNSSHLPIIDSNAGLHTAEEGSNVPLTPVDRAFAPAQAEQADLGTANLTSFTGKAPDAGLHSAAQDPDGLSLVDKTIASAIDQAEQDARTLADNGKAWSTGEASLPPQGDAFRSIIQANTPQDRAQIVHPPLREAGAPDLTKIATDDQLAELEQANATLDERRQEEAAQERDAKPITSTGERNRSEPAGAYKTNDSSTTDAFVAREAGDTTEWKTATGEIYTPKPHKDGFVPHGEPAGSFGTAAEDDGKAFLETEKGRLTEWQKNAEANPLYQEQLKEETPEVRRTLLGKMRDKVREIKDPTLRAERIRKEQQQKADLEAKIKAKDLEIARREHDEGWEREKARDERRQEERAAALKRKAEEAEREARGDQPEEPAVLDNTPPVEGEQKARDTSQAAEQEPTPSPIEPPTPGNKPVIPTPDGEAAHTFPTPTEQEPASFAQAVPVAGPETAGVPVSPTSEQDTLRKQLRENTYLSSDEIEQEVEKKFNKHTTNAADISPSEVQTDERDSTKDENEKLLDNGSEIVEKIITELKAGTESADFTQLPPEQQANIQSFLDKFDEIKNRPESEYQRSLLLSLALQVAIEILGNQPQS